MDRLLSNVGEQFNAAGIPAKITRSRDRFFVEVDLQNLARAKSIISHIFGLVSFSHVLKVAADKPVILETSMRIARENIHTGDTFAIRAQRAGKHGYTSNELERECGALIVRELGNNVNLTRPDKTVYVDVRDNEAYVFSEKIPAVGGLPLGVEGKVAVLFSGDYERSAVSAFLMMKRGCKVFAIFTGTRATKKEKDAIALLSKYDPIMRHSRVKSEKTAFVAARKNRAFALVIPDNLSETLERKISRFDRKTGVFVLEPLAGQTDSEVAEQYTKICSGG